MPAPTTILAPSNTILTTTVPAWVAWNEAYSISNNSGGGGAATAVTLTGTATLTGSGAEGASARIWLNWITQHDLLSTTDATTARISNTVALSTTAGTAGTWSAWNQQYVTTTSVTSGNALVHVFNGARVAPMSDEEYQERARRAREQEVRWAALQSEREEAKARAALILRESLTPEQQAELADKHYFTIRSIRQNGEERLYRIHRGRSNNVERVDAAGRRVQRYCMHPIVACPDEDTMLAQKLWLQSPDLEDEFLRCANRS